MKYHDKILELPSYLLTQITEGKIVILETTPKVGTTPVLFSSPVSVSVIACIRDTLDILV